MQNKASINVQCPDPETGKVGTFIKENDRRVSPLFADLYGLFPWMKENGWKSDEYVNGDFHPWRVSRIA